MPLRDRTRPRRLLVDPAAVEPAGLGEVVDWLRRGGLVIFPTDTYYGLAVDPASDEALRTLFAVKGRPAASALPFVAASLEQVEQACGPMAGASARLAARCWPGPLSLVLPAPASVARAALAGGDSVAIRVPASRVARALASAWGAPLPATSANRTGAAAVREVDALDRIADDPAVLVIDAGETPGGAASTIVDARGAVPRLWREGAIAWSRVLDFLQE